MFKHFFRFNNRISKNQLIRTQQSSRQGHHSHHSTFVSSASISLVALSILHLYKTTINTYSEGEEPKVSNIENEKVYRQDEVSQHKTKAKRIWVTYQDNVYDITDFVPNHPGGQEKIILAAGGAVEPFWKIYQQHYNSKLPLEILNKMKIGKLHPDDVAAAKKKNEALKANGNDDDPYRNDPELSPILHMYQKKPINAEAPETLLTQSWITPNDLWFKRNHHPIPRIKEEDYRLTINIPSAFLCADKQIELIPTSSSSTTTDTTTTSISDTITTTTTATATINTHVEEKNNHHSSSDNNTADNTTTASSSLINGVIKEYTLQDLKSSKFTPRTVTVTLQCGGNRRMGMNEGGAQVGNAATLGIAWTGSAISTAEFTGVRLLDVLIDAGLDREKVELLLDELTSLNKNDDNDNDGDGKGASTTSSNSGSNDSNSNNSGSNDSNSNDSNNNRTSTNSSNIGTKNGNNTVISSRSPLIDNKQLYQSLKIQNIQELHTQFVGLDDMEASIPMTKVLNAYGDVLLAYSMNGEAIPAEHGYPVRVIVPGHVGVRNVKWVSRVTVATEESKGPWQRGMAYKGFGPSVKSIEGIDVEKIPSVQEQAVTSMITYPVTGQPLVEGETNTIKGFAYSGGGRGIVRVDVSADGGHSWQTAELTEGSTQPLHRAWAWTFWEADINIPSATAAVNTSARVSVSDNSEIVSDNSHTSGNTTTTSTEISSSSSSSGESKVMELICKATDASYNVQPDSVAGIWNLRGINNNAWHRKLVQVVTSNDNDNDGNDDGIDNY